VLYPAVPDYEFRCASTDTRISFECRSNAPNPTLECPKTEFECPKTKFECIRKRENQYPDIGKPIFGYRFGCCFIVFGPNVMVYELYVGHPPCGISVHPVSISAGPTWHPAVSSNSMDGSIYYPDCMLPMLTGAMACSLVYIHTT